MSSAEATKKRSETPEERAKRHAARKRKVAEYRAKFVGKSADAGSAATISEVHKQTLFALPIRFTNDLPDVPVEQRFVNFPFDEDFVTSYDVIHGVSSASARPRVYHPEADLSVGIDLAESLASTSIADVPRQIHPDDAFITSDEFSRPAVKKAETVDPNKVEWVLYSQHLHNDLYDAVYKHSDSVRVQAQDLERRKVRLTAELNVGDKRSRIEASFAAVSGDALLVHPTNPSLAPKTLYEVLPDQDRSGMNFVAVAFDTDPDDTVERKDKKLPVLPTGTKRARLDHALLKTAESRDGDTSESRDGDTAQAANAREQIMKVEYLLPDPEDVDPVTHGAGNTAHPYHARPIRDYQMLVDTGAAGSASNAGAGTHVAPGADAFVWAWDADNATVSYVPVKVRAFMTRAEREQAAKSDAERKQAAKSTAVHQRQLVPEEEDLMAEARALLDEVDPTDTLLAIAERRRARAEQLAAAKAASSHEDGGAGGTGKGGPAASPAAGGGAAGGADLDGGYASDF